MNQGQRDEMLIEMHTDVGIVKAQTAEQGRQIETLHTKIDANTKLPIKNASSIRVMWIIGGGLFTLFVVIVGAILAS